MIPQISHDIALEVRQAHVVFAGFSRFCRSAIRVSIEEAKALSYSGLTVGTNLDRSKFRNLFPTGEFFAINLMHSQNPFRSPGAWQAYR